MKYLVYKKLTRKRTDQKYGDLISNVGKLLYYSGFHNLALLIWKDTLNFSIKNHHSLLKAKSFHNVGSVHTK